MKTLFQGKQTKKLLFLFVLFFTLFRVKEPKREISKGKIKKDEKTNWKKMISGNQKTWKHLKKPKKTTFSGHVSFPKEDSYLLNKVSTRFNSAERRSYFLLHFPTTSGISRIWAHYDNTNEPLKPETHSIRTI